MLRLLAAALGLGFQVLFTLSLSLSLWLLLTSHFTFLLTGVLDYQGRHSVKGVQLKLTLRQHSQLRHDSSATIHSSKRFCGKFVQNAKRRCTNFLT